MAGSRFTLGLPGSRLLAAIAIIAALTAVGLVAGKDAKGSTAPGMLSPPALSGTPAPSDPPSPSAPTTPTRTAPTIDISPRPPTVPTNLVATSVKANSVTLTWTASAQGCCGVVGYDISYTQAFNDIYWVVSVGNVTTATITSNIQSASQYTFHVTARDSVGHRSASSNAVTVVTPISDSGPDTTPPGAPSNLNITEVTSAGAALTWSPSTDDTAVTGYNVYWFDGWYTSRLLATVAGTAYTAPLSSGRNLFYVRTRDAAGNVSIASGTATVNNTTSPSTSPPASTPTCRVTYANTAQWAHGFVANVTVTNTGQTPVDGWSLAFTFGGDQRITSSWNGTFTQTGTGVTMTNANWNGVLAPGASATVGLQGTWASSNTPPTAYSLNTLPCTTA